MKLKIWLQASTLGLLLAAFGCESKKPEPPAPPPPQEQPPATQPAEKAEAPGEKAEAPGEVKDEDIPVAADFEAAVEGQITDANYKTELNALDKEIASTE